MDSDYQKRIDAIATELERLRPTIQRTATGLSIKQSKATLSIPIASYPTTSSKRVG
jgi:hypothetical protein